MKYITKIVSFLFEYRRPIGIVTGGILIASGNEEMGQWVHSLSSHQP